MTPARWQQVTDIFHAALALAPERRDEFLRDAYGADLALRSEVESLMAAHHAAGSFGDAPMSLPALHLEPGRSLGPYRVDSLLGAGGMGEVYRATDPRLGRAVAIKVLPSHFPSDAQRLGRFEREARLLASLNHPHIGAIYGVEEHDGGRALVMELVEGEDLAQRLARGPIRLAEALPIARQIADALEAAHEQGIIHRDLKPANIKVRHDGTAKVLDFGLAKLAGAADAGHDVAAPDEGGRPVGASGEGLLLGTAAYMSPEQAQGNPVDRRTDIWAFGCVLYEMLTGSAPFAGDTIAEIGVAILEREPDWTALPAATPAPIRRLLRRSLEKDRKRRHDSAADARLEIDEALSPPAAERIAAARPRRMASVAIAGLAGGAVIAAAVTWAVIRPGPVAPSRPSRFTLVPPPGQPLNVSSSDRDLAVSPDGRHLVYRAGGSITAGSPFMLRAFDQLDAQPLADVVNAYAPFFSPNGRWIAFFETAELKKVSIDGGPVITVGPITGKWLGGSWGDDNRIVFATDDPQTGLRSVSADGGPQTVLTTPNRAQQESDHLFPSVLPGGRAVLFTVTGSGGADRAQVAVLDRTTGQRKVLVRGSQAEYVESSMAPGHGHLIYATDDSLRAVRFDPVRLEVLGGPVTVVEHVMTKSSGAANYTVSRSGTLVYTPSAVGEQTLRSLVWVDRKGFEYPIKAPLRAYGPPRISPDGRQVLVGIRQQANNEVWIWDLTGETLRRVTFAGGMNGMPLWTSDGRRIIYMSDRAGVLNLYRQSADGTGPVERLTTSANQQWPTSVTRDGTHVFGFDLGPKNAGGVIEVDVTNAAARPGSSGNASIVRSLFPGDFAELSPDGRYLAYSSEESGRIEVYVRPYPDVDRGRWQISQAGGSRPTWARSGRELFYLDASEALTVVPVQTAGPTFVVGSPATVFVTRYAEYSPARHYDVSPDGQRFLMLKNSPPEGANASPGSMVVVEHWFEELTRLAPREP